VGGVGGLPPTPPTNPLLTSGEPRSSEQSKQLAHGIN
jgi:hypothetical protein